MPASFIARTSRSSSPFVTAGPNHHQRIMMRASSGGLTKDSHNFLCAVWATPPDGDFISQAAAESSSEANDVVRTNSLRVYRRFIFSKPFPPHTDAYPFELAITSLLTRRGHLKRNSVTNFHSYSPSVYGLGPREYVRHDTNSNVLLTKAIREGCWFVRNKFIRNQS